VLREGDAAFAQHAEKCLKILAHVERVWVEIFRGERERIIRISFVDHRIRIQWNVCQCPPLAAI